MAVYHIVRNFLEATFRWTKGRRDTDPINLSKFIEGADPGPWLRRIAHNLAIDRARRASREIMVEEIEDRWQDDDYTIDPSVTLITTQTREELEDALARLPFIYRSTVVLHDVDGWTVREIADLQQIGIPAASLSFKAAETRSGRM